MKEALFYAAIGRSTLECQLCPRYCRLGRNKRGKCNVRKNVDGRLISENYGLCSAIHFDPIEKKPLYHFYPGRHILSMGSIGCNLKCDFCQNCSISQTNPDQYLVDHYYEPCDIVAKAQDAPENLGLAFTYNEPTVYYEFMLDAAKESKTLGMMNVMVSNGFINPEPMQELLPYMDGFNIDLKAFSEAFYKKIGGDLEPVKEALKSIKKAGKHLEITTLVIPTRNDELSTFIKQVEWIVEHLGNDSVLHISRYFPAYKSKTRKTSLETLQLFFVEAKKKLNYVYLGNIAGSEYQNTICSNCEKIVISRYGSFVQRNGLDQEGNCTHCHHKIVVN